MKRKRLLASIVFAMPKKLISIVTLFLLIQPAYAESSKEEAKSKKVEEALAEAVAQSKVPGMVAAITSSKGVLAIGTAGVRKIGTDVKLTKLDRIHLGSCTKAMTSVLLATLVAEEKLTWETSLIDILPELKGKIHSHYHTITVWQLLTHRAGVEANAASWWFDYMGDDPATAPLLKEMRDKHGKPRVCEDVYLSYLTGNC